MKNKSILLITFAILANLFVANFALAQSPTPAPAPAPTPTPTSPSDVVYLPPSALALAQTSETECRKFRKDIVMKIWPGQAKAIWADGDVFGGGYCAIVPGDYPDYLDLEQTQPSLNNPDGLYGTGDNIPKEFVDMQAQIAAGQGVQSDKVAAASARTMENETSASWFSTIIGGVLVLIFTVINAVLAGIAAMAGGIFNQVVYPILHVTEMPLIVTTGWTIVRDVCNMFFILAMIVIALATILRIEEYDYKELLKKVVLMALLVNFSQVIAVTLMNAVNFVAAVFWSGPNVEIQHLFGTMMRIANPVADFGIAANQGAFATLALVLGRFVFTLVATVVFIALAGMFLIRLVGLYVLIIFSPVAFVAQILPATEKYSEEWWSHFIKYLIWAPVALFMLRLVILIVDNNGLNQWSFGDTSAGNNDSAFLFFILAGFMAASLLVAEEAGMVGGKMVVNAAEKAAHWAGHRALHYAGKKWNNITSGWIESHDGGPVKPWRKAAFAVLNPVATLRGYEQRAEETAHMAKELATAGGREIAEQVLTGGKLKIPYRQFVERKDEDKFLKDYGQMKKESLMRAAVEAEGMKGIEGDTRKRAIVKAAASNGFMDDLMRMKQFANKYTGSDNVVYGAESLNRFLYGYLGHGEQAQRFMAEDMEELGKKTKHFEYLGHAYYDNDSKTWKRGMDAKTTATQPGEYVRNGKVYEKVNRGGQEYEVEKLDADKDSWQVRYSSGEFAKQGGRDRVAAAPHNFTVIRAKTNADGTFMATGDEIKENMAFGYESGQIDAFNTAMMGKMDADVNREIQHTQERTKHWLLTEDRVVTGTNGAIVIKDTATLNQIKNLYKISPNFVKGLYTKALGLKGDDAQRIDGVRFVFERQVTRDAEGKITGHVGPTVDLDPASPATFDYDDKRSALKDSKKAATP